jgi:predicted ArsR family transcriptional regulator
LAAPTAPDDAFTTVELAEQLGVSDEQARYAIKALLREGAAECVRVVRLAMDGRHAKVPAYRLRSDA